MSAFILVLTLTNSSLAQKNSFGVSKD